MYNGIASHGLNCSKRPNSSRSFEEVMERVVGGMSLQDVMM